jgi:hypothetical protein
VGRNRFRSRAEALALLRSGTRGTPLHSTYTDPPKVDPPRHACETFANAHARAWPRLGGAVGSGHARAERRRGPGQRLGWQTRRPEATCEAKIGAPRASPKKPAKKPVKQVESNKASKKPGSEPKQADPQLRASVAGKPIEEAAAESPELKGLREVDDLLFWDIEVKAPLANGGASPVVTATGLPPTASESSSDGDPALSRDGDHRWMSQLRTPDLPFRWDVRLIRYLDYFKNNPKGQTFVAAFLKRSGRYEAELRAALKKKGLPEDLVYLARSPKAA